MTQPFPAEYRWVRYDGPETRIFIPGGEWVPGEAKHVPADLARRLLLGDWFTATEGPEPAPAADPTHDPDPPKSRKPARAATEPASNNTTGE